ncbi:MAG: ribonuclease P protein component [Comamonadaceae bacterium]|nr:ribonuclease P protein component [Comamonadaceae bacterium]
MRIRHLKTRQQFQAMLAQAPIARTAHFCLHRLPASALPGPLGGAAPSTAGAVEVGAWVGALVPKRWAKRAVTRNLIRRQVYAVALEHLRAACSGGAGGQACPTLPGPPGPAGFAWLVRLRAGFHAPAAAGRGKGKKATPKQPAPGQPGAAAATLRSAASPQLRQQVRGQLQLLFARATAHDAAAGQTGPEPKAQP